MCRVFEQVALIVNWIFLLNNVFYCVALLQNCICLRYVNMLVAIVCLTSLKYMALKTLVRTSSFRFANLFYDISFIFCCIFLRDLGKHVFLWLDKTVYQFIFFVIFDQLLYFYCIVGIHLYGLFYSITILVNSIFFRYLGQTLLMILNNVFYSITL